MSTFFKSIFELGADEVTNANVGRQLYSPADIGCNKAVIAIQRVNRFFGLGWIGAPQMYNSDNSQNTGNILITCVDSAKARLKISKLAKNHKKDHVANKLFYWLDFGNLKTTGQVILGSIGDIKQPPSDANNQIKTLKTVTQLFDLTLIKEENQGPSCSLAEAIGKQDLFINSTLANLGCNLLWKLFTDGKIDYHGLYLNLETMQTRPIKIGDAA